MTTDSNIEYQVMSALLEKPTPIEVEGDVFRIYPTTLGKSLLIGREIRALGVDEELMRSNPSLEALRLSSTKSEEVSRIIALSCANGKDEVLDDNYITNLTEYFQLLRSEQRAYILLIILTGDNYDALVKHFGIDEDMKLAEKAHRIKSASDNSMTFGGKSLWGSLIDWAAERYGWSVDYILWGVSYTALRMLQLDSVKNVYMSEEERKKMHVPRKDDEIIRVDNMSLEEFEALGIKFD